MTRAAIIPHSLAAAVRATGFSPAVRAGDLVFLTGATGAGADQVMASDIQGQLANILDKLDQILSTLKAPWDAVVEMTSYHIGLQGHFDTVDCNLRQRLGEPLPAWTAVEVAGLRREGALCEFRFVLHVPQ